jgi:trimeric autotransporter adhesin
MLKRLIMAVLLVSALPVMAGASWYFSTQVMNSGGIIDSRNKVGQSVTDGALFHSYTTSASIPVIVTPAEGYSIRTVTVNGTAVDVTSTPFRVTVPGSYSDKSVTASFLASGITMRASITSGTVNPASVSNIFYGYTLTSPITFSFTPSTGYAITKVSGSPFTSDLTGTRSVSGISPGWSVPGGTNQGATVTFPAGYTVLKAVDLLATTQNMTPTLDHILPQSVTPGILVKLQATPPAGVDPGATYQWQYVSGPANQAVIDPTTGTSYTFIPKPDCPLTGADQLLASFTAPGTAGQYKFVFTIKNAYRDANAAWQDLTTLATVNVFATQTSTADSECQFCHSANGIGPQTPDGPRTLFNNWSSSMHKVKGVMCARCHVGADQGGHPGSVTAGSVSETTFTYNIGGGSFCLNGTCHAPANFATHKTVGMSCVFCHSSATRQEIHNPDANFEAALNRSACLKCHGAVNTTHYYTKESLSNQCLHCHKSTWQPHTEAKAAFFPVFVPPAHFNGYTSYTNPGYAAAYVTPTTSCADCHAGGDPLLGSDKAIKQYRDDWRASGHGLIKGSPWLNSGTHNWKASGMAGVQVRGAGAPTDCQRCHTATGYVQFTNLSSIAPIATPDARYSEPLTCNACHNSVDPAVPNYLRTVAPRTGYYNYSSAVTGKLLVSSAFPDSQTSNICLGCHSGREAGNTLAAIAGAVAHKPYSTAFWQNAAFVNSHYLAAGGQVFRTTGYEYPGQNYASAVDHAHVGTGAKGPCVTCHMPGKSHTLDAASTNYSQCVGCHGSTITSTFVKDKTDNFDAALKALGQALTNRGFAPKVVDGKLSYPYFTATNWGNKETGPGTMGAAFNYNLLVHDPGAYAHNPTYAKRLLRDSIDFLTSGKVDRSRNLTATIQTLLANTTEQDDAASFLGNSSNGSSACIVCHGGSVDPVHKDPIVTTYKASKHSWFAGGAGCGDCHSSSSATTAHPATFTMLSTATQIAPNCWGCHQNVHTWQSQGLCMRCHNPHNPWPPSMNSYPHFSSFSTAQYVTAKLPGTVSCDNCHKQASSAVAFAVYSANSEWAKSSHGDPKGPAYIGVGPYTEANLEAFDFKFLGTTGTAPSAMATTTNPATAAHSDCVRCHTSTGFVNYITPSDPANPSTSTFTNVNPWGEAGDRTREMVSCPACHTPTPFSATFGRRPVGVTINAYVANYATYPPTWVVAPVNAATAYFNYSSPETKKITRYKALFSVDYAGYPLSPGDSNICVACHSGRAAGDVIKQTSFGNCTTLPTITCRLGDGNQTLGSTHTFWKNVDFIDPHGGCTTNMLYPDNLRPAYEYRSDTTSSTSHAAIGTRRGSSAGIQGPCVACHMSRPGKHRFAAVSSASNGIITKVSTLCSSCHGSGSNTGFNFGTNLTTLQGKKDGYAAALSFIKAQLADRGIHYNRKLPPYFFTKLDAPSQTYANRTLDWTNADVMGAAFNLRLLDSDNGWVHNGTYAKRVLYDTIDYLDNGLLDYSVAATLDASPLTDSVTRSRASGYIAFGGTRP